MVLLGCIRTASVFWSFVNFLSTEMQMFVLLLLLLPIGYVRVTERIVIAIHTGAFVPAAVAAALAGGLTSTRWSN